MRVIVCVLLVGSVVLGSLLMLGGRPRWFADAQSFLVPWLGTILFMLASYDLTELRRWFSLGLGLRKPIEVWEHRLAKRMCVVATVVCLALALLNFLAAGTVLLMSLSDPTRVGPAIAVMILSPMYAVFLAGVVIAAMWAQITRFEP